MIKKILILVVLGSTIYSSFGAKISYQGHSFVNYEGQQCLAIIEASPYDSQNIVYSIDQFLILIENVKGARAHILEKNFISYEKVLEYLKEIPLRERRTNCVTRRALQSLAYSHVPQFEIATRDSLGQPCHKLEVKKASTVIREYTDPLEEKHAYWRGHYSVDDLQKIDIRKFIASAQRYLIFYDVVNNSYVPEGTQPSPSVKKRIKRHPIRSFTLGLNNWRKMGTKVRLKQYQKKFGKLRREEDVNNSKTTYFLNKLKKLRIPLEKMLGHRKTSHERKMEYIRRKMKRTHLDSEWTEFQALTEKMLDDDLTPEEEQRFGELSAIIESGIKKSSKNIFENVETFVNTGLDQYNTFATDAIIDMLAEKAFDTNIDNLMPMSHSKYNLYRFIRGFDATFVMTTTILGFTLSPFTMGLSQTAAGVINSGTTLALSLAGSAAKSESMHTALVRGALRTGHGFIDSQIPIFTDFNAFFTSLDDLRVAVNLNEKIDHMAKRGQNRQKWRPTGIGAPQILSLLNQRLNFLENGLIPRGKYLYKYTNMPVQQRNVLKRLLKKLEKTRKKLRLKYQKALHRYEWLLESGRIPREMLKNVIIHLDRGRGLENLPDEEVEESIIEQMVIKDQI